MDFHDVEHFALQILVDEETEKVKKTAEEFRDTFEEIMIDEYQDSNEVQETLLRSISREERGENNIFMVGDVKQSIYRFRLARPETFHEKIRFLFAGREHHAAYRPAQKLPKQRGSLDLHKRYFFIKLWRGVLEMWSMTRRLHCIRGQAIQLLR